MDFEKTRTYKNLTASFAGECQDGAKYQFIAKIAKDQQLIELSNTIRMLAKEEMGHAGRIFELLTKYCNVKDGAKCEVGSVEGICITATYPFKNGSLTEMLSFTQKVEKHQKDVVYKDFSKVAKQEGYDDISEFFTMLGETENCHSMLVQEIYDYLKKGKLYSRNAKTTWKCSNCGHETEDKCAPKNCPLCTKPDGYVYLKTEKYKYYMP